MTNRTIIDILRKGNQELFHSAVIAWLMNPVAEHGYGAKFLNAFADIVAQKGYPKMRDLLHTSTHSAITTESTFRKKRYDITVALGSNQIIIENKTKSIGEKSQFDSYECEQRVIVALGLCEMSFSDEVARSYPVITYGHVLSILNGLPEPAASDFSVLVEHYRRFLQRELMILSEISNWYESGDSSHINQIHKQVSLAGSYTTNDRRFLNLCLLEQFRRDLFRSSIWKNCQWKMNKNNRSGVWLALFDIDKESGSFRYDDSLADSWQLGQSRVWFHVELRDGLFAATNEAAAAIIQLRCESKDIRNVIHSLRSVRPLLENETYPSKVKQSVKSSFLIQRTLRRDQLCRSELHKQMNSFVASFGKYGPLADSWNSV